MSKFPDFSTLPFDGVATTRTATTGDVWDTPEGVAVKRRAIVDEGV